MDLRNRRRLQAVVIVGIFAASMIGAAAMMMSGWSPPTRSTARWSSTASPP